MRIRLTPLVLFALLALACSPLQQILDLGLNAPAARSQNPQPSVRSKSATPTRVAVAIALNGAQLQSQTTAHENLYLAKGIPGSFQQTVITDADIASRRLMSDLGWSGSPRVNIYVFPSRTVWLQGIGQIGGLGQNEVSFQASLQGDAWITINGVARSGIYLYPIQQSSAETLHMLAHEYTHAVQQETIAGQATVPDWFLEGMAEAEGWRIAASQYPREYARAQSENQALVSAAAKEKRLFSLSGISAAQSWQIKLERPWSATLEYAESQMAIEYLQKLKGTNAPMNILIMTANDGDFTTAFQQSMGMSISAFETKFFASLE